MRQKKRLQLLLPVAQLLVSAVLLGVLLRGFDWGLFRTVWDRFPLWLYAVSLLVVFLGQCLYALKWRAVLRQLGGKAPTARVVAQSLIALFFGNFLPTAVGGDISKIYHLGAEEGYGRVSTSVLIDRGLSLLWLSALAALSMSRLQIEDPVVLAARSALVPLCLVAISGCACVILAPIERLRPPSWISRAGSLPGESAVLRLIREGRAACRNPMLLLQVGAIVFAYFAMLSAIYKAYFWLGTGVDVPLPGVFIALIGIAVLSNIPISLNGIGLREQLHSLLFAAVGAPREVSVAVGLVVLSQLLVISLLGCGLWIRSRLAIPSVRAEPPSGLVVP